MIRLRKKDGTAIEVPPDVTFVELVNDVDGSLMLVFMQVQPGAILKINPGTSDAARYESLFHSKGVVFSPSMIERTAT